VNLFGIAGAGFFCYGLVMSEEMQLLKEGAGHLGVSLDDRRLALFDMYRKELLKWNATTNLISEKSAGEIICRHFLDSLAAAKFIPDGEKCIVDAGSGAGFPGIPLKIALPHIRVYLLEANRKKISFLKHVIRLLGLDKTWTLHDRMENIVREETWRGKFDIVTSRAAFKLPDLLPLADHFLGPAGLLITLKAGDVAAELAATMNIPDVSVKYHINQYDIDLPFSGPPRKIIVFQKVE